MHAGVILRLHTLHRNCGGKSKELLKILVIIIVIKISSHELAFAVDIVVT